MLLPSGIWIGAIVLLIVAGIGAVIRLARRASPPEGQELGSVSGQWIAEYRASQGDGWTR
jgi:hypothetical protein